MVGYISTSINDGPGCLLLRCPDPSCGAAVGQDMINSLASDEDKEKYSHYLHRSYIEDNKKVSQIVATFHPTKSVVNISFVPFYFGMSTCV